MEVSLMKKKYTIVVLTALCTTFLTGCNQKTSCIVPSTETITKKAIVVVKQDDREYLSVGETNQLTAYSSGTATEKFVYKSMDENKASVDENGLVTALAVGDVKIEVSLKSDSSVKKSVFFTIVNTLIDSLPELKSAVDDIKSYDYRKGANIPLSMGISLGDISVSTSLGDYSLYDTYENPISFGSDFDIQHYQDENNESQTFLHSAINVKEIMDNIKNAIPDSSLLPLDDVNFNAIYQAMANQLCPDFDDYLKTEDFDQFVGFDFYSYGKSDTYLTASRNFGTDQNPSYEPFAYHKGNLLDLLSPYADEILGMLIKSLANDSTEVGNEKFNEFLNKLVPGYSIDSEELFTKDGMLFLQTVLANFLETETEGSLTTIKLNQKAMEAVQNVYSEYVTETDFDFPIYEDNTLGSFSLKFSLPKTLSDIKLVIDNSLTGTHKVNAMTLQIDGTRKVNDTEVSYPFLSLKFSHPIEKEEGEMDQMSKEIQQYDAASKGLKDVFSSSLVSSTLEVKDVIEKANEIYNAEKEYGADTENKNLQDVKDKLMTYYYSDVYQSKERQNLLYPMRNRLSNLDFDYQDEYVTSYSSLTVDDENDAYYTVNHFEKGEDVADFTKTYSSSDERILTVDENGRISGHMAYYNGEVVSNQKKTDNTATIKIQLDNGKTFQEKFSYIGDNVGFEQTQTKFVDGITDFDYTTHELTLHEDSFDLSSLFEFPSQSTVTYRCTSLTQAYFSPIKKSELKKSFMAKSDTLGGIVVNVKYPMNGETKSENMILYFKY